MPYLSGITFEGLNKMIVKGDAALFALSGLLLLINQRRLGAVFLIVAASFILLTKDNVYLRTGTKVNQADYNQRVVDFFKHLSLIGAALILIDNGGKKYIGEKQKVKNE